VNKISRSWVAMLIFYVLLFVVVYLADEISCWIRQRNSSKFCANVGKSATGTLKAFGEESMSRTRVFEWHIRFRADQKRPRQVESKVKSMFIIFFVISGIVHKEFVLAGQQSIPRTTMTFYGDFVSMCKDFAPNFGDKRTGCYIMTTHRLTLPFTPGNF
jgi:hypothetical protein